jgi:hypothetical protein
VNTPTSGERAAPFLRDLWVGYARTSPPLDGSWSHCSLCSYIGQCLFECEYRDRNCMLAHMLRAVPARDPHRL